MAGVSVGHLAADLAQGGLPAVLVFLRPALHLTYTMTAAVVLVGTVTSSLAQPICGHLSDRRRTIWLMPAGVGVGCAGLAAAAVLPTYAAVLITIGISGVGIGAFHPEAMKIAGAASGPRRSSGMALFATGGNIGFALGPLLAGVALTVLGRSGGLLLVIPGVVVAAFLLTERRHLARVRDADSRVPAGKGEDQTWAFRRLLAVIVFRSVAYYGLFTFVPLWEVAKNHSTSYANTLLSIMLLAGVVGTLCAGPLADRYGQRTVLLASLLATPGLVLVYVFAGGWIGIVALCASGALTISTFGITIVMSQEYLPTRVALASGMSVGVASGLGGVAAVVLGALADTVDLRTALVATAIGPALGVLLAASLPRDRVVPLVDLPAIAD